MPTNAREDSTRLHQSTEQETKEVTVHLFTGHYTSENPQTRDRALLLAAIRKLPAADQQLVMLYLEGLSALEIEEVTGVSSANVATRLSRIRKSMSMEVSPSL